MKAFAQAWQSWRNSPEANTLRQFFQKKEPGQDRLSKQIWHLKQRQQLGQWIAEWIHQNWDNWYQLSHSDRRLWTEFSKGDILREIRELEKQQRPKLPGAAEAIHALT